MHYFESFKVTHCIYLGVGVFDVMPDGGRSIALESWLNDQGLLRGGVLCTELNGKKHFCYDGANLIPKCSYCDAEFTNVFDLAEHLVVTRSEIFAYGSRPAVAHMCTQTDLSMPVEVGTVRDSSATSSGMTINPSIVNETVSICSIREDVSDNIDMSGDLLDIYPMGYPIIPPSGTPRAG